MTEVAQSQAAVNGEISNEAPEIGKTEASPADESTAVANGNAEPANGTNGTAEAKTNGHAPKAKKEAEPPKDPKEDPIGWLKQQHNAAIHKINYYVLDWLQKAAIEDESKRPALPLKAAGKQEAVTRSQFQAHLKDGQILAHLANKLAPGSVETVHEGEAAKDKANQTANIQAFINFVKEKVGFSDDQVFSVEDLQERGKAGYEAVMNTLFQLGFRVQEKFGQTGIELDQIVDEVKKVVDPNFFQKVIQAVQSRFSAIINTKFTRSPSQFQQQPEEQTQKPEANGESNEPAAVNGAAPTENGKTADEAKKEPEAATIAAN